MKEITISVQFTTNSHGVTVKECCASCAFKTLKQEKALRWCEKHRKKVRATTVCDGWEMSELLNTAGLSGGVVRDMRTKEVIIR